MAQTRELMKKLIYTFIILAGFWAAYTLLFQSDRYVDDPEKKVAEMEARIGEVVTQLTRTHFSDTQSLTLITPPPPLDPTTEKVVNRLKGAFPNTTWNLLETAHAKKQPRGEPLRPGMQSSLSTNALKLIRNAAPSDGVIVCTPLGKNPPESSGKKIPPLIVWTTESEDLTAWFASGHLRAAIVPRTTSPSKDMLNGNWFDITYEVLEATSPVR